MSKEELSSIQVPTPQCYFWDALYNAKTNNHETMKIYDLTHQGRADVILCKDAGNVVRYLDSTDTITAVKLVTSTNLVAENFILSIIT